MVVTAAYPCCWTVFRGSLRSARIIQETVSRGHNYGRTPQAIAGSWTRGVFETYVVESACPACSFGELSRGEPSEGRSKDVRFPADRAYSWERKTIIFAVAIAVLEPFGVHRGATISSGLVELRIDSSHISELPVLHRVDN